MHCRCFLNSFFKFRPLKAGPRYVLHFLFQFRKLTFHLRAKCREVVLHPGFGAGRLPMSLHRKIRRRMTRLGAAGRQCVPHCNLSRCLTHLGAGLKKRKGGINVAACGQIARNDTQNILFCRLARTGRGIHQGHCFGSSGFEIKTHFEGGINIGFPAVQCGDFRRDKNIAITFLRKIIREGLGMKASGDHNRFLDPLFFHSFFEVFGHPVVALFDKTIIFERFLEQ